MKIRVFFIAAFCLVGLLATSQEPDTDSTKTKLILEPIHRNVIKFNPTPMLLFSKITNITFSYERLIRDNQSFALQVGYLDFDGILRILLPRS